MNTEKHETRSRAVTNAPDARTAKVRIGRGARIAGAALVACLLALSGTSVAHAAPRSDLRGSLTVSATVAGGGTLDGFVYDVTSPNCLIDVPAQATTDAAGVATFSGLFLELPNGTPCLYDVAPAARTGYAVDSGGAVLTGLTAGTITVVPPSVQLTASAGILHSPTRNPEPGGNTLAIQCLEGENTSDMRAGRSPLTGTCNSLFGGPFPKSSKTGLAYTSPATPQTLIAGSQELGRLAYINNIIQRGFHNSILSITLDFTDPSTGNVVTVTPSYTIAIDYTDDTAADPANCPFQGPNVPNAPFACADRVSISGGQSASFEFGGADVDLQATLGIVDAGGTCGAPSSEAFAAEGASADFCLIASLSDAYSVAGAGVTVANLFQTAPNPGPGPNPGTGTVATGASPRSLARTGGEASAGTTILLMAAFTLLALGATGSMIARRRSR